MPGGLWFVQSNGRAELGSLARRLQRVHTDDIAALSLHGGQFGGRRSRFINGGCRIAQRGQTNLVNNTSIYGGADRWVSTVVATTVSAGFATNVALGAPSATGFGHQLGAMTTTGTTALSVRQRLEAADVFDMNSQTVSLSGWVWHDFGSTVTWNAEVYKANAFENFGGVTLVGSAGVSVPTSTWTFVSLALTLGSSDASNGLLGGFLATGLAALTNKNAIFTNMQFEIAATPTVFERLPGGLDVELCQRYFEKSYDLASVPGSIVLPGLAQSTAATAFILSNGSVRFTTRKRVTPTVTLYSPNSGAAGNAAEYNGGGVFVADRASAVISSGEAGYWMQASGTATPANDLRWHWTASAEL